MTNIINSSQYRTVATIKTTSTFTKKKKNDLFMYEKNNSCVYAFVPSGSQWVDCFLLFFPVQCSFCADEKKQNRVKTAFRTWRQIHWVPGMIYGTQPPQYIRNKLKCQYVFGIIEVDGNLDPINLRMRQEMFFWLPRDAQKFRSLRWRVMT